MLEPPEAAVYQYIVLPAEVAFRLMLAPAQIEVALLGVTEVGAAGTGFTVIRAVGIRVALRHPEGDTDSA